MIGKQAAYHRISKKIVVRTIVIGAALALTMDGIRADGGASFVPGLHPE